ncbi:MAG: hypothetical protein ACTHOK_03520 [Nocardioidaceae bacterium]
MSEPPVRVLFVCTANICRSAYADLLSRHLLGGGAGVEVASAGTRAVEGEPVDEEMAALLRARGIDPTTHRSRRLSLRTVGEHDLVVTAEVAHRSFILDDRPAVFRRLFTLGQLDRTLDGLPDDLPDDLRGRELIAAAGQAAVPADPDDDVHDPYRRGPEAARTAAAHIEALVSRWLPRLTA